MGEVSKVIKKIIFIILMSMLIVIITFSNCNAARLENENFKIFMESEFEYKIDFGEKLTAIDLEMTFDETKLVIEKVVTEKAEYNRIGEGRVVVVYVDETGNGTDSIVIKFKAKKLTGEYADTKIKVENINAYSLEKEVGYSNSKLNIEFLTANVKINMPKDESKDEPKDEPKDELKNDTKIIKGEENSKKSNDINVKEETTSAKQHTLNLPKTGDSNVRNILIVIAIIMAMVLLILIVKYKKIKSILPVVILGALSIGTIEAKATSEIFIKRYENIKNAEKVIVVMPDIVNRSVKRVDFQEKIQKNIQVEEILNAKNESMKGTDLIATGCKVIIGEKGYRVIVYGDINSDGIINSNDIGLIINEMVKGKKIEGTKRKAANVSNAGDTDDKIINKNDIDKLKNYILRKLNTSLVDELPEEYPGEVILSSTNLELDLSEGRTANLIATVMPSNVSNKFIVWTSSDENTVKVDASGKVTAISNGTATITASTINGKKAECTVTVKMNMIRASREYNSISLKGQKPENVGSDGLEEFVDITHEGEQYKRYRDASALVDVAEPSPVEFNNKVFFYFRGENALLDNDGNVVINEEKGKIRVQSCAYVYKYDETDGVEGITKWNTKNIQQILNLGNNESDDDYLGIHNVSACVYKDRIYLFYRGEGYKKNGETLNKSETQKTLMYAISNDGINFEKKGAVSDEGGNVNVNFNNGYVYAINNAMYLVRVGGKDCKLYYFDDDNKENNSSDGELNGTWIYNTEEVDGQSVDGRIFYRQGRNWSEGSIQSCRMYSDKEYVYVFFGAHYIDGYDYPEGIGVARAKLYDASDNPIDPKNLLSLSAWEVYSYNPIMLRGALGAADEGAVWSFTPFEYGGTLYAFYEGCGSDGLNLEYSLNIRKKDYWGYTTSSYSSIMVCTVNLADLKKVWDKNPLIWNEDSVTGEIGKNVKIYNVGTGKALDYNMNNELIVTDKANNNFYLTFDKQFYRIKGANGYYVSPEMKIKDDDATEFKNYFYKNGDYPSNFKEYIYGRSYGKYEIYAFDVSSNFVAKYKFEELFGTKSINALSDWRYNSSMGLEWELYPVEKNGATYYKIQNRWTGRFMNVYEIADDQGQIHYQVNQSQETNEDNMLWKIMPIND